MVVQYEILITRSEPLIRCLAQSQCGAVRILKTNSRPSVLIIW